MLLPGLMSIGVVAAAAAAPLATQAGPPGPPDAGRVVVSKQLPQGVSPQSGTDPAPPQQPAPTGAASAKAFNPDISVIGNFIGIAGKNPNSEEPSLSLTEAEVAFQAVVDPYARADFYFAASEDGVEIEEGFITFTSLPAHLLLKVGKLRAQFGRVNTLHTHSLPTADRPLVTTNLVGGEEGMSDAGFSVSHLLQIPAIFVELTGEVFRGDSEVFQTTERSDLNYVGRVRAYRDLTEATNLDVGFSYAQGPSTIGDQTSLDKRLIGVDATFRYRPLRRAIYQRLNLRTELIWSRQDLPVDPRASGFGFYGLGEYQFARRWYVGARGDRSARIDDGDLVDTGGSVFLTFWPTEFSQIRGQYRRINYAEGTTGNEFLVQFNFAIGAHGAHVF